MTAAFIALCAKARSAKSTGTKMEVYITNLRTPVVSAIACKTCCFAAGTMLSIAYLITLKYSQLIFNACLTHDYDQAPP